MDALTDRQRFWLAESDKDARAGNDLAAGIFALMALPSDAERRDIRDDAADGLGTGRER